MKWKVVGMVFAVALAVAIGGIGLSAGQNSVFVELSANVNFGPASADLRELIIQELQAPVDRIDLAMHAFTDRQLANEILALKTMHGDEIEIRVIFDPTGMHAKEAKAICEVLKQGEIQVYSKAGVHLNLAVLGDERVLTGSAHWSANSLVNQENDLLVINDERFARSYRAAFRSMLFVADEGCPQVDGMNF